MKEDHLTKPNPELESLRAHTIAGMAHWAGTGPKGKTCGECEHHVEVNVGVGTSFRCDKYRRMMQKSGAKRIPERTPACKYWESA